VEAQKHIYLNFIRGQYTNFFHKLSIYRKNLNIIWEVANQYRIMVKSFKDKENVEK
jgi:hypothetical protein